jgi:hypothetical protein
MGRLALERKPSRADSRRDVRIERRQRTWNRASRLHLRTGDVSTPDRLRLCAARPDTDDLLQLRRGRLDVGARPRPSAGARRLVSRCRTGDAPLGPRRRAGRRRRQAAATGWFVSSRHRTRRRSRMSGRSWSCAEECDRPRKAVAHQTRAGTSNRQAPTAAHRPGGQTHWPVSLRAEATSGAFHEPGLDARQGSAPDKSRASH